MVTVVAMVAMVTMIQAVRKKIRSGQIIVTIATIVTQRAPPAICRLLAPCAKDFTRQVPATCVLGLSDLQPGRTLR